MLKIYIDIETIPSQTPAIREAFLEGARANFRAPSDLTKAQAVADLGMSEAHAKAISKDDAVAAWENRFGAERAEVLGDSNWRKTALDGALGELAVIGYAIEDEDPVGLVREWPIPEGAERHLLDCFFGDLGRLGKQYCYHGNAPDFLFIGHNLRSFDLRFLWQRSVVLGIKPPVTLQFSRYSEHVADTMEMWAGIGNRISLEALCRALGVTSPKTGDLDGSKVWDYIQAGRIDEVANYCRGDVDAVRECYRKMTYADIGAALSDDLAA